MLWDAPAAASAFLSWELTKKWSRTEFGPNSHIKNRNLLKQHGDYSLLHVSTTGNWRSWTVTSLDQKFGISYKSGWGVAADVAPNSHFSQLPLKMHISWLASNSRQCAQVKDKALILPHCFSTCGSCSVPTAGCAGPLLPPSAPEGQGSTRQGGHCLQGNGALGSSPVSWCCTWGSCHRVTFLGTSPSGKIGSDSERGRRQSPPAPLTTLHTTQVCPNGWATRSAQMAWKWGCQSEHPQQFRFVITTVSASHIRQAARRLQHLYSWPHIHVCFYVLTPILTLDPTSTNSFSVDSQSNLGAPNLGLITANTKRNCQ